MRCEMGTILRATPGLQPRFDEPFVIVDRRLRIQAISHQAEVMLLADEPAVVGLPLAELLVCRPGRDQIDFDGLVQRAVGGSSLATRLKLRTVSDPAIEVVARVACCSPPAAALLTLTPLATARTRSERAQRRDAVAEGSLAG